MLNSVDFTSLKRAVEYAANNSKFYIKFFNEYGVDAKDVTSIEQFQKLPFSDKHDLRNAYPLGLQAVPDEEIVRIHSSSGTTGKPVIIPYTKEDVDNWATMFARCYSLLAYEFRQDADYPRLWPVDCRYWIPGWVRNWVQWQYQ